MVHTADCDAITNLISSIEVRFWFGDKKMLSQYSSKIQLKLRRK